MKLEDVINKVSEVARKRRSYDNQFLQKVFENKIQLGESGYEDFLEMVEKSDTTSELMEAIMESENKRILGSQIAEQLAKYTGKSEMVVRKIMSDTSDNNGVRVAGNTISDSGSLKIGSEGATILIPNGSGDGVMTYALVERGHPVVKHLEYLTMIDGFWNIYDYDCGDKVANVVQKKDGYNVYFGYGFVVFEEVSNNH